jgi:uncharacterized protein YaaW (UPF0174 family)
MEILETSTMQHDDFEYIADPVEYERGMEVYNEKIRQEGREEVAREYESIIFMLRQKNQKTIQEIQKIEQTIQKLMQEKQRLMQETQRLMQKPQKTEEIPQTEEQMLKKLIRKSLKKGDSVEDIAEFLEIDMPTIERCLEQIKVEDEAEKSKK